MPLPFKRYRVLMAVVLASCQAGDTPSAPTLRVPTDVRRYVNVVPSNGLGVNVNQLNGQYRGLLVPYLSRFTVVRFDMLGSDAVPSPGTFVDNGYSETIARIKSAGAVPLAVLTWIPTWACATSDCNIHKVPSDAAWASVIETMVSHAVDMGVEYFEVGNEPGIGHTNHLDWSPTDYDRLARIAIQKIHAYGKIAMGPAAGSDETDQWMQERIKANVTSDASNSFDIISLHGYGWGDDIANKVERVQAMVPGRQVWLTEAGGGGDQSVGSPEAQAAILRRLMERQTWAQTIWYHLYQNDDRMPSRMLAFDPSDSSHVTGTEVYRVASRVAPVATYWSQNTHLFTWEQTEFRGSDRFLETPSKFHVLTVNTGGLAPLIRCVFQGARKVRRLSLYGCPAQFISEGLPAAWVSTQQKYGWQPLYALIGSLNNGYYTTDNSERATALANGWSDAGVLAYVPITPELPVLSTSAADRVAVHAAWSQTTHIFYEGSYAGNVPSGFVPTSETHFVVSTTQITPMLQLLQCTTGDGRNRVALGSCPSGWWSRTTLGYALPYYYNNGMYGADHVLTEYRGANGAYYVTADPQEQASMSAGGWTKVGDVARVWF